MQIELALGLECSESTPKTNNGKGTNLNRDAVVGVREQSMKIFVLVVFMDDWVSLADKVVGNEKG